MAHISKSTVVISLTEDEVTAACPCSSIIRCLFVDDLLDYIWVTVKPKISIHPQNNSPLQTLRPRSFTMISHGALAHTEQTLHTIRSRCYISLCNDAMHRGTSFLVSIFNVRKSIVSIIMMSVSCVLCCVVWLLLLCVCCDFWFFQKDPKVAINNNTCKLAMDPLEEIYRRKKLKACRWSSWVLGTRSKASWLSIFLVGPLANICIPRRKTSISDRVDKYDCQVWWPINSVTGTNLYPEIVMDLQQLSQLKICTRHLALLTEEICEVYSSEGNLLEVFSTDESSLLSIFRRCSITSCRLRALFWYWRCLSLPVSWCHLMLCTYYIVSIYCNNIATILQ